MKPVTGLIGPDDLQWRPSNLMKIPNADFLERTGSENPPLERSESFSGIRRRRIRDGGWGVAAA